MKDLVAVDFERELGVGQTGYSGEGLRLGGI